MELENIFDNSSEVYKLIKKNIMISSNKRKVFDGKSFACVFFTKFCSAKCSFCFFKSDKKMHGDLLEECEFSDNGFEKFIRFINLSNNGYLLISGGGEPFEKYNYILESIKQIKTDRIVIVTSGYWATDYNQTKEIIEEINETIKSRHDRMEVILRLSLVY